MTRHESQRGYFAYTLYEEMKKNKNIWLVCIDLGYKVFDSHFSTFPNRCLNTGAAEQGAMDIAFGLALDGKIPFIYSITPFIVYRAFETIRTYINHENIPVKICGSGRDKNYHIDGFSHDASDVKPFMDQFMNIKQLWPKKKEEVPNMVKLMIEDKSPYFISLVK